jgi:hypothetical protein
MQLQGLLTQIEHALTPVRHVMKPILSDPLAMGVWALFVVASVGTLWWDIRERNQALPSLMKGVWTLVVGRVRLRVPGQRRAGPRRRQGGDEDPR